MQKTKKFLSALLAVIMIVSVFSFSASAGVTELAPDAPENIAMKLEVEHEDGSAANSVIPGETVTVKIYVTARDPEARVYGGMFLIFFNSDIYTFVDGSRQWGVGGTTGGFIWNDALMAINDANNGVPYKNTVAKMTEEELAYGWNAAANIQVQNAAGTVNTNAPLIKANAAIPFLTFKLKVSDTVAPGTAAPIGIPVTAIAPLNTVRQNYTYIQTWTDADKTVTQNRARNFYVMDTIAELSVASATPTYSVEKAKSEVMFTGDKAHGTPDDLFTYRLTSKMTAADFTAINTNGNTITEVGFIAANASATDVDAAKAAVETGTALPTGWKTAKTDYISQANEASDAFFGCRIKNISHAAQDENITCAAYVAYTDADGATHYVWYAAPYEAAVSTGYNAAVSQWAQS